MINPTVSVRHMKLDRDENFTVRSWQAVVTLLLQDYRFTHE